MSARRKSAKYKNSNTSRRLVAYIVLGFLTVLCLFWFYLLGITASQSHGQLVASKFSFLPGSSFVDNIKHLTSSPQPIYRAMVNSFIIAGLSALICTYFSTVSAYAIHAYNFKGKNAVFTFILGIMMIPTQVTVLGFVRLLRSINLLESWTPLILPSIAAPVTLYYLKQYMESTLPMSLIEAARIDGSGEIRTFNTIALPLMKPAIAVQAIFTFVGSWNNYFVPSQVLVKDKSKITVPIVIANLRASDFLNFDLGQVYMTIFMAIFPVIVVYLILSKNIVGGLALGSVKG